MDKGLTITHTSMLQCYATPALTLMIFYPVKGEIRNLHRNLDHPNIVGFHGITPDTEIPVMVIRPSARPDSNPAPSLFLPPSLFLSVPLFNFAFILHSFHLDLSISCFASLFFLGSLFSSFVLLRGLPASLSYRPSH